MISILLINQDLILQKTAVESKLSQFKLNPDDPAVLWIEAEDNSRLSIKEVKKIKEHFHLKPWGEGHQIVVIISADKLSDDAQNALLKILEEPPVTGQLILTAGSTDSLLPTIISRCQIEVLHETRDTTKGPFGKHETTKTQETIKKLLASDLQERFQIIEKTEDKDQLLLELEKYFAEILKANPEALLANKVILQAKEWSEANGNIRGILEYLMLNIRN